MENEEQQQIQAPTQQPAESTTPLIKPKKPFKKWVLIVIIFILVLCLSIGGYLILQNNTGKTSIAPSPTPTLTDQTANWKTYLSSDYQIKYPNTWTPIEASDKSITGSDQLTIDWPGRKEIQKISFYKNINLPPKFQVIVFNNSKSKSLQQIIEEDTAQPTNGQSNTTKVVEHLLVSGSETVRYSSFGLDHQETRIMFIKNSKIYYIIFDERNLNDSEFKQNKIIYQGMLSTFKFTP